jgi:hypothetical protein
MDAINLLLLRTIEWLHKLSPLGKAMLGIALYALLALAAHFGLVPQRHRSFNGYR